MSGIVGVVNWDGAPVDRRLVERMTATVSGCGPDGQHVWTDGPVGFGHAWLRTSATRDVQPRSLEARVWITADARIDGRPELVRTLRAHGCHDLAETTDAELILHAYAVWGEACVSHLFGDFSFAIWDGARRRVLCARDHFGVKPFFYAEVADSFVFSNSLECIRLHPGVSNALDDGAIADFLMSGGIQDPAITSFADIRRLPAAHCLAGSGRLRRARYWTLPVDGSVRYRRRDDYVEHFRELLENAVTDRLRCDRAGVLMSGGLDSTAVAATAKRCLSRGARTFDLRAYTTVCERVLGDPERRYAQLAADALGIPIHYRVVDDYRVFERWDKPEMRRAEPESDPLLAVHVDQLQEAAANGRVLLTGYGADAALRLPLRYAVDLLTTRKLARLAREIGEYVLLCRRLPRVRMGSHARRWLAAAARPGEACPAWLTSDFAARCAVRRVDAEAEPVPLHPIRPHAYHLLTSADWSFIFESYDPSVTGAAVEVRHPFFDRRLVEYLLAIPPMPWCFDKTIVRLAMRRALPDRVRLRPKTVAAGDPLVALLRQPAAAWVDDFEPISALRAYVDRGRVPRVRGEQDPNMIWTNLRPLCLNYWLTAEASF